MLRRQCPTSCPRTFRFSWLLLGLFTVASLSSACGQEGSGATAGAGEREVELSGPSGPTDPTAPAAVTPPAATGVIPLGGLGWQASGGRWDLVEAGVIEGTGELTSIGDVTDIAVSFECRLTEGTVGGVTFAFRERSGPSGVAPQTGYRATFDESGRALLTKPGDVRFAPEQRAEPRFSVEGWNRLRILTVGPHHEVLLNGSRVATAEDPQWQAGRFALRVPGSTRLRCRAFEVSPGG